MPHRKQDLAQFDPFRRPNWRWDLAERIATGELPRRRGLDDAMKAAIAFRRSHEHSDAYPSQRRRKSSHNAAIAGALELSHEDGPRRWELEACVLANQPPEEIAARCRLSVGIVQWYESLFFDCRPRLHAWGWISFHVFGPGLRQGFGDNDLGRIWAACAYFGGILILDALIAAFRACGEQPSIAAHLAPGSGVPLAMQAVLSMMVLPQSRELDWVYMHGHLRLIEAQTLQDPSAAEQVRERVARDLIKAARLVLAGKPVPRAQPSSLKSPQPKKSPVNTHSLEGDTVRPCWQRSPGLLQTLSALK